MILRANIQHLADCHACYRERIRLTTGIGEFIQTPDFQVIEDDPAPGVFLPHFLDDPAHGVDDAVDAVGTQIVNQSRHAAEAADREQRDHANSGYAGE